MKIQLEWDSGKSPADFNQSLEKFRSDFLSNLNSAANRIVERGVKLAKSKAPVDTGELRNSIRGHVEQMMEVTVLSIMTDVEHGIYQEFGTIYQGAQPYLRPTLQELEGTVVSEVQKAWRGAISNV